MCKRSTRFLFIIPMNSLSPYQLLQSARNAVFLETVKITDEENTSLLFIDPVEIIQVFRFDEVFPAFQKIEKALEKKYYLAGYISYECGYYFEELDSCHSFNEPLLWFGVYEKPIVYNKQNPTEQFRFTKSYSVENIHFSIAPDGREVTPDEYSEAINTIRRYIHEGDIYQANFTGRMNFQFKGSPLALYNELKLKQRVGYAAYIQTENQTLLSLSPELFYKRIGNKVIVKPMKGTLKRGNTVEEDRRRRTWLATDEKNKAENVMIVDVLRNDLGKISELGSVKTTSLYDIETYDTLFQMTSTIEATLKKNTSTYELFKALFPSGSVTGAPKRRAMEIIRELETTPRGIYTGAIGYIAPTNESVFNIAIRTVVLPLASTMDSPTSGQMGTGGGIVWDSNAQDEFMECQLKSQFLSTPYEDFRLIETILLDSGFHLLDFHLDRLRESCLYFDFPFDSEKVFSVLHGIIKYKRKGKKYKIRLLLDRLGNVECQATQMERLNHTNPFLVNIAPESTNSNDRFLYHKTTHRQLYDEAFKRATDEGLADYIFTNERGEVTEGAISNIIIYKDGFYFTPPVTCGVLNGVYRRYFLKTQPRVKEQILHVQDLVGADKIYICNAVRGMREVILIE